jgi:ATP-dependent Lon protease
MALLSAFYHVNITNATAFTGEISLLGSVLPVGGIKQKVLAAHQASIKQLLISLLSLLSLSYL